MSDVSLPNEPDVSDTESKIIIKDILNVILKEDISDSNFLKNEVDPVAVIELADRIDRDKLVAAHNAVFFEKLKVTRKNELLSRTLLKHFRLKKVYRAYSEDNPNTFDEMFERYTHSLDQLDTIISSLKQIRTDCSQKLFDAKANEELMAAANAECVDHQIKEIKEATKKMKSSQTGHTLPEQDFEKIAQRMNSVRNRISEIRLQYIKAIDKHTEIDNLAKSLEDLGGGLRLIDFEQLRNECQTLSDKIEERTNDLARLRVRCDAETQILAHMREKEFSVGNLIIRESEELDMLVEEMDTCREFVNRRKGELESVRRHFKQLSDASGLLDRPALLVSFDRKTEKIDEFEAEVVVLRASIAAAERSVRENEKLLALEWMNDARK